MLLQEPMRFWFGTLMSISGTLMSIGDVSVSVAISPRPVFFTIVTGSGQHTSIQICGFEAEDLTCDFVPVST